MAPAAPPPPSLEAKLVVLGAQGVGKTSLVHRYLANAFIPPARAATTVGASFLTTRVQDAESGATLRLQIWDTAGQERFRSISRLYYRGAHAAILCYDVTSRQSFDDMGAWLRELREHAGGSGGGDDDDMIVHVVGTKSDIVAADPRTREVPFERCIGYVAEQLYPDIATPGAAVAGMGQGVLGSGLLAAHGTPPIPTAAAVHGALPLSSSQSNRSSGFWGQEQIWDCCHEISAKDGEGIDEVFRVITRKLIEQQARRQERLRAAEAAKLTGKVPGVDGGGGGGGSGGGTAQGYFDLPNNGAGSFRVGHGDKRRSWISALATPGGLTNYGDDDNTQVEIARGVRAGRCC